MIPSAAESPRTATFPQRAVLPPRVWQLAAVVWVAALVLAFGRIAADEGWWSPVAELSRIGAAVATWLGLVLLTFRIGGRYLLVAVFSGVALGVAVGFPESWVLAGAAVVAATAYGVLGMVMTRPAPGLSALRELAVATVFGLAGAVVVSGYDVALRPSRFRLMVLSFVLAAALALAWRLGLGMCSLGRRGVVLIVGGVGLLAVSVAYTEAVRRWGSPDVVQGLVDAKAWVRHRLGTSPRPIEALVGVPALMWGAAIRNRRRQGWWMCAFGSLASAGMATSMVPPRMPIADTVQATGYNILIGAGLGLLVIAVDRLLTGSGGRRARCADDVDPERPEPPRLEPLL